MGNLTRTPADLSTPTDDGRPIQTLANAYAAICYGEKPWVALNEFFHEWFDYSRHRRAALVAEAIRPVNVNSGNLWRWAVFCAAAAEYLCECDGLPYPSWATDPAYILAEPWYGFGDSGATSPAVRAHLERVTPEPLRRRNIFGGDKVFANKYDLR